MRRIGNRNSRRCVIPVDGAVGDLRDFTIVLIPTDPAYLWRPDRAVVLERQAMGPTAGDGRDDPT